MKKLIFKVILLLLMPCFVFAADNGKNKACVGVMIGDPTGINGKLWFNAYTAVDAGFSILNKNSAYLHVTYLWHNYHAFPKPETGQLPFYYGGGFVFSKEHSGIRTACGIEYLFTEYPFDIFLELSPLIILAPDLDLHFTGLLGVRYYWK